MTTKWRLSQKIVGYRIYQQFAPITGFLIDCPRHGINIRHFVYFQKKNDGYLYFYPEEYSKEGKRFFKNFLQDQSLMKNSLSKIFNYSDDLRTFSLKIKKTNLKKLSDKELLQWYKLFHKYHNQLWRVAMIPNILEFENSYLTGYLMTYLSSKTTKSNVSNIFSLLLQEDRKSGQQKRDEEALNIAKYLKSKGKDFIIKDDYRIKSFYNKYNYLTYNWSGPTQSFADFISEIRELSKLSQGIKCIKEEKINKKTIISDLEIDKHHLSLFHILTDIIFSKSYRMEASYFAYYNLEKLFKEISLRLNLSVFQIQSIPPHDMKRILVDRKYIVDEINNFVNLGLYYRKNNKICFISSKKAKRKLIKILPKEEKHERVTRLTGQVAFPGRVEGFVRIINNQNEIDKFKTNDILVSSYTDPTLMSVIRKAKAIITDVGGMTCHAAIVSRELKKPCIIGTKIATQVLQDGDKIEVDANNGVIRILARNKKYDRKNIKTVSLG